ncbi:MAG: methyl-accepting chemotaxis protein [Celeribacter sp.]|jgi:methyl-accepting chemotaxis protein
MPKSPQDTTQTSLSDVRVLSKVCIGLSVLTVTFITAVGGQFLIALVGGTIFAALGLIATRLKPNPARILIAQALVGVTITLNAALLGHPLQVDAHMVYFAVLAMTVMLGNISALLAAAATIAVHHVILTLVMPTLLFPSFDLIQNIGRTAFHAVIVIMETAILFYAIRTNTTLTLEIRKKEAEAQSAAAQAQNAFSNAKAEKQRAEDALTAAQAASEEAAVAKSTAETALKDFQSSQSQSAQQRALDDKARADRDIALQHLVEVFGRHLDQLSSGDLSTQISESLNSDYDGLKESFNIAVMKLGETIHQVREQSENIQNQSREISNSANDLSVRTEHQAVTLADIARSITDLTASLSAVAKDSSDAQNLAQITSSEAAEGSDIMQQAVHAMAGIEGSSKEIHKITAVIDDIAFQTNLLALNAGVEAARAGDAGRGFAVVASEVRALAQRSSDAAREINNLITTSVTQISSGADLVNKTGYALEGIKKSVDKITNRLSSVASATSDQSRNLSSVNSAIGELEGVTQQNVAMFEETTAANTQLSSAAHYLSELVQTFVTTSSNHNTITISPQKKAS